MTAVRPPRGESGVVHLCVLGRFTVTVDGVDSTPRGRTQQRLITALALAASRDIRLPLTDLVDEVYRDDPPPKPRRSLATLVWRLRKSWGAEAIESDQYSYWLSPQHCRIDVAELEAQLHEGSALARAGDSEGATKVLQRALVTAPTLGRRTSALPVAYAERIAELVLGATERLGELLVGAARFHDAVAPLEQVTAARPTWEHSQALLITAHLELEDRRSAHRVSDQARRALVEQGLEPGPELSTAIERADGDPVSARARPAQASSAVEQSDDLIGRTTQLTTLVAAADAALEAGRATALAVAGEAGIGKSTLAGAVLARLGQTRPNMVALTLPCDPRRTLPYAALAPLIEADEATPLARLLRGESEADPAGSVDLVHAALLDRLRALAAPGGLVLLVEDVHWAHEATIAALAAILERGGDLPLAVITTSRHRTVPEPLAGWVERRIRLRGLTVAEMAELLGTAPDDARAAAMHRHTGGNPLYVRHLRAAGQLPEQGPAEDLTAAIDAHLRVLPGEALNALRIAAVVGDTFTIATLVGLDQPELQRDRPTWRRLLDLAETQGLIRADTGERGQYHFVHTLVREHLYASLSPAEQTRAHAAIGRALQRIGLSRPCPADLLAHHYVRGWPELPTCAVIEVLTAAAEAAGAQLDFTQATAHYRTALDYLAMDPQPGPDERTAQLLAAAAGASAAAGQTETANKLYSSLLHVARQAGWNRWRLSAALGALRTQYTRQVGLDVTTDLAEAVAAATGDRALAATPDLAGEALAAIQVYRPARAAELLAGALDSEPELSGRLRTAIWEHQDVQDQLTTARQLVADPTADPVGAWLRLWVSEVAAGLRALDDRPPTPTEISDADHRTRFDVLQWRIATTTATGRLERARRMIDEALAAPRHPDPSENAHRVASLYGQLTYLALIANDVPQARNSPLVANPTWANRHPIMRYVRAYMLALNGPPEAAREWCDELLDEVRDHTIPDSDIVPRLVLLGRACVIAQHQNALEPCLEHLVRHRGEHGIFRFGQYWGPVDGTIGRVLAGLGDLDGALAAFDSALTGARRVHANLEVNWIGQARAKALERLAPRRLRSALGPA